MTPKDQILSRFIDANVSTSRSTRCKRKLTWCSAFAVYPQTDAVSQRIEFIYECCNGTILSDQFCSDEIGNCGCMHAEQKLLITLLSNGYDWCRATKLMYPGDMIKRFIFVSKYSLCSNCANIIIESGIVRMVVYNILTEHDKRGVEILVAGEIEVVTKTELEKNEGLVL